MMTILKDRTPRERGLIYGLIFLSIVFVLWVFVIMPLMNTKAIARSQNAGALRDLEFVKTGITALAPESMQSRTKFDQSVFVQKVRADGLTLSRLQPETNGALRVWLEGLASQQIYNLLQNLMQNYDVDISRIQINRRDDGRVDVQMTISPS